jgi:spermidine synthase
MRSWILYALFFLSGTSALIYELIWQRLLNLVVGVSTLSVSAVLAAFMGGLALGGFLFGRLADRAGNPLRLYALLEAVIGLSALSVPAVFGGMRGLYVELHHWLNAGLWAGLGLRLSMAAVVLAVPATLMGGTLPLMGRLAVGRLDTLSKSFSLFYAVNTLGAVLGAALTGFFFLRLLGMQQTMVLAAGLNWLVAGAAWLLSRAAKPDVVAERFQRAEAPALWKRATTSSEAGNRPLGVLALAAVTGAASMALEVVWTRILGILTCNSAYGFALLLSVMLSGLALGAFIQAWWSRRPGNGWARLAACQWLLALVCLVSPSFFHRAPAWFDRWCDGSSSGSVFFGEFLLTAGALLVPAVLLGASLPLLVAGARTELVRLGAALGRIYAFNTLGCVAGALIAGLAAIPWLGIQHTLDLIVLACAAVSLTAWLRAADRQGPSRLVGRLAVASLALLWMVLPAGPYLKSGVDQPRRLLFYREGNNATVSVIEEFDGVRSILVDSQPVAGTARTSVVDQKMLAHLPLLLHPEPKRALTIGFVSGGTSYSMCLHGINVDCVEKTPSPARRLFFALRITTFKASRDFG